MKAPPGVNLTKGNLHKHNQAIMGYIHGDDTRKTILAADGIADDGTVNPGAVDLNNLDDWHIFWAQEIKQRFLFSVRGCSGRGQGAVEKFQVAGGDIRKRGMVWPQCVLRPVGGAKDSGEERRGAVRRWGYRRAGPLDTMACVVVPSEFERGILSEICMLTRMAL